MLRGLIASIKRIRLIVVLNFRTSFNVISGMGCVWVEVGRCVCNIVVDAIRELRYAHWLELEFLGLALLMHHGGAGTRMCVIRVSWFDDDMPLF